jgi:hypothetical protein
MTGRRWTPVTALLFSLVTLPAHAQTPIASAAANWCADLAAPCAANLAAASVPAQTQPIPPPPRKDSGRFPLLLGAFTTAASADLAITMYQIGHGTAREVGFGSKWQRAPVPFALTKSGMAALFVVGLQRMHKDRPKTAFILGLSATIMESMLVVRSARIASARSVSE